MLFLFVITIFSTNVYFANFRPGVIAKVPIAGGDVTTIANVSTVDLAIDSANAYATGAPGVVVVPLLGGTPASLPSSADALGVAVDTTSLYWTAVDDTGTGVVSRLTPK